MKIQEIESKIAELKEQAKALQAQIDRFELDPDDYTNQYDEMLDEVNGEFMGVQASRILKEMDPTAYRCGLNDYVDSLDLDEELKTYKAYAELTDSMDELTYEIETLEDKLVEMDGLDNE